jgi:hypothetical protein
MPPPSWPAEVTRNRLDDQISPSRRLGFADRFLDYSGCAAERYTLLTGALAPYDLWRNSRRQPVPP